MCHLSAADGTKAGLKMCHLSSLGGTKAVDHDTTLHYVRGSCNTPSFVANVCHVFQWDPGARVPKVMSTFILQ